MQEKNRDFSIIKKRIIQYLEFKDISKYEFYQKTKIPNGILSQKGGISEENILRFLSYYTDINPTWLLTGEGEMLRGAKQEKIADKPAQPAVAVSTCPQCALKDRIIESQEATIQAQKETIELLKRELEQCGWSKKPPLPDTLPAEATAKLKPD